MTARWLLCGLCALLLAGCPKRERQPGAGGGDRPPGSPPLDGGFAVTGRGAGARPGILAAAPIDATVDAALGLGLLAVPECARLVQVMEDCAPQLTPPAGDSMVQGAATIREQWTKMGSLPPESLDAIRDACQMSADSMVKTMRDLGCVLP